jgi:hypothetical protein
MPNGLKPGLGGDDVAGTTGEDLLGLSDDIVEQIFAGRAIVDEADGLAA